jgi:hypothetical protein
MTRWGQTKPKDSLKELAIMRDAKPKKPQRVDSKISNRKQSTSKNNPCALDRAKRAKIPEKICRPRNNELW